MCGIVGAVGLDTVENFLIDGLRRLEYRGYDSAGIAVLQPDGAVRRARSVGKVAMLDASRDRAITGHTGIAHTRWATHGGATENNAHPHRAGRVTLVHNGIIENFQELRRSLQADGYSFQSETDTEVVAGLLDRALARTGSAKAAMLDVVPRLQGAYALAVLFDTEPGMLFGARHGAPLLAGMKDGAGFIASDALALTGYASHVCYLENGDLVAVTKGGIEVFGVDGVKHQRELHKSSGSAILADKGNYKYFMLKEIHEQAEVVGRTLTAHVDALGNTVKQHEGLDLSRANRILIIGCGTAALAGRVAEYWLEGLAGIPVDVDIASEFRYRDPVLSPDDVAIFISQSGETADTLEAMRLCKEAGAKTIALVNTLHSTMARDADLVLPTLAGPEIGVASTKAFTCQLIVLASLALLVAKQRGRLTGEQEVEQVTDLLEVPGLISEALDIESQIAEMAVELATKQTVLYLGRHQFFPLALEGALKLKEISYIHAEGYAAGELKHGPIALIEPGVSVIAIAPHDALFAKTQSSIEQVLARGGSVIAITDEAGAKALASTPADIVKLPSSSGMATAFACTIAIQLIAYYVAVEKGTDVDQPRNLAKSVTVE